MSNAAVFPFSVEPFEPSPDDSAPRSTASGRPIIALCTQRAHQLYRQGHHAQAELIARGLLELDPGSLYLRTLLVGCLQKQGRVEEAIVQVEEALALQPGDVDLAALREALIQLWIAHLPERSFAARLAS